MRSFAVLGDCLDIQRQLELEWTTLESMLYKRCRHVLLPSKMYTVVCAAKITIHRSGPAPCTDLIGTPPSALGKRKLEPYREFGRAAVAAMRFVPIPDGERMPKRGRGCGEGAVIYPRGDTVSSNGIRVGGLRLLRSFSISRCLLSARYARVVCMCSAKWDRVRT